MEEDPTTEALRHDQERKEQEELEEERESTSEDEAEQHERRAEKADYLKKKLEERAESEPGRVSSARDWGLGTGDSAGPGISQVAPSLTQQRTMSRMERTPVRSPPSTTTRWRNFPRTIASAARSSDQLGSANTRLAEVVAHLLAVGVLTRPDRLEQIALGDDSVPGWSDHRRRPRLRHHRLGRCRSVCPD